jgi:eukaryotic-like serine/threonine-protein kinase
MSEESLLQKALSRAPEEHAVLLELACAGRPELLAAFEAILAAHDMSGDVDERPRNNPARTEHSGPGQCQEGDSVLRTTIREETTPEAAPTAEYRPRSEAGIVIAGRYTLQEKIGEGGMGEVWVAKQTEPVKRKVALKLIKSGMDSKAVLQRFEQERQALAMMDHPHIARVLDGGLTPLGQPFFVMELVNGLPLTRFCDESRLSTRERLELFVPICQAVQHAHQKGIIHRDLKPANILVSVIDGKPVPKVIDFGVAKAIAGKLTDESMSTQFGLVLGTFEYMSPEQAAFSGEDIDTRADIYSLGVILYGLLTGLRPIDAKRIKEASLTEMIRIIREEEPSKPSTRLSTDESLPSVAALRGTEPRKLIAALSGELDWVVMKCLEKQRERRYETANALARDIERYLADETVEARPPSASYRLRKFLKRNKGSVIAASLLLVALLGGIAGTTFGLIRAERARAAAAEKAEGERLARLQALAEREKAVAAQKAESQQRAQAIVERDKAVAAEARSNAVNQFLSEDLLSQAEPMNNAPEDHVTVLQVLDRAAENVGKRFVGQPNLERSVRVTIAATYHALASYEKAETQWRLLRDAARRREPQSHEFYYCEGELAHILRHRGRRDAEVLKTAETAAHELERTLGRDHQSTLHILGLLGAAYVQDGKLAEAIPLLERLLNASISVHGPDHVHTFDARASLGVAYHKAGQYEKSVPLFEDLLKRKETTLGRKHPSTQTTVGSLGVNYVQVGRLKEAVALLEEVADSARKYPDLRGFGVHLAGAYVHSGRVTEAIALDERLRNAQQATLDPDDPIALATLNDLAVAYWNAKRLDKSVPLFEDVLKRREAKLGRVHPDTQGTLGNLGVNYKDSGRLDRAIPLLEEAYRSRRTLPTLRLFGPPLAEAYGKAGRSAEAMKVAQEFLDETRKNSPKDSPQRAVALAQISAVLLQIKAHADAERVLRECLAIREKTQPDLWTTFNTKAMMGSALLHQKKYVDAELLLKAGYEGMKARETALPPKAKDYMKVALQHLVMLYEAIDKPDLAAKWRKTLHEYKTAEKPLEK